MDGSEMGKNSSGNGGETSDRKVIRNRFSIKYSKYNGTCRAHHKMSQQYGYTRPLPVRGISTSKKINSQKE